MYRPAIRAARLAPEKAGMPEVIQINYQEVMRVNGWIGSA